MLETANANRFSVVTKSHLIVPVFYTHVSRYKHSPYLLRTSEKHIKFADPIVLVLNASRQTYFVLQVHFTFSIFQQLHEIHE